MSLKIRITIIAFVIILSIIGMVSLIILPTMQDINKISEAINQERRDLEIKYQRGQLLNQTVQDFEKIQEEKIKLDTIFINEGEELKFISALEEIATKNGIDQNINLTTTNLKDIKGVKKVPITITANGGFIQTISYLKDIEKLDYYINIASFKIATNREFITTVFQGEVFMKPLVTDK